MKIDKIKADKVRNKNIIPLVDGEGNITYSQKQNSFRLNNRSSRTSMQIYDDDNKFVDSQGNRKFKNRPLYNDQVAEDVKTIYEHPNKINHQTAF